MRAMYVLNQSQDCPRREIAIVLIASPLANTHITFFSKNLEGEGAICGANSRSLNRPRSDAAKSTLGTSKQGVSLETRVLGILVLSFAP